MNKDKMITLLSINVINAYDHVSKKRFCTILKRKKFRHESLFEQTIFCKMIASILSLKTKQRQWTTLTSTYRKICRFHSYCICSIMSIFWNFWSDFFVEWSSLILWTTLIYLRTIQALRTIIEFWRKCTRIARRERVVMTLCLRRSNTSSFI
jgi:hypothetical protein